MESIKKLKYKSFATFVQWKTVIIDFHQMGALLETFVSMSGCGCHSPESPSNKQRKVQTFDFLIQSADFMNVVFFNFWHARQSYICCLWIMNLIWIIFSFTFSFGPWLQLHIMRICHCRGFIWPVPVMGLMRIISLLIFIKSSLNK